MTLRVRCGLSVMGLAAILLGAMGAGAPREGRGGEFVALFPEDGVPKGWVVRHWSDVSQPPPEGAVWKVEDGVLHGSTPRGTWLVSEKEYGDFVLELEFRLGEAGNSGIGLRFPDRGDPAFDGMELQIVDPRYHGTARAEGWEMTGSIYKAAAPFQQVYKPTEWNRYQITLRGPMVRVRLNDVLVQEINLDQHHWVLERGTPLKDRPRKGRIGFQELSRGGSHVQIRNARIRVLDE